MALFALCIGGAALAASRPTGSRRPYYFGTFGLFALAGLSVAGVAWTWASPEAEVAWKKTSRDGLNKAAPGAGAAAEREVAEAKNAARGDREAFGAARRPADDFAANEPMPANAMPPGAAPPPRRRPTGGDGPEAGTGTEGRPAGRHGRASRQG